MTYFILTEICFIICFANVFLNFESYEFILFIQFSFRSFVLQMQLCMRPYERGDGSISIYKFFLCRIFLDFFDAAP